MKFTALFGEAFGDNRLPFDYQVRLAGGDSGAACRSQLISIPTGLGKTAAVVLAWLWNRTAHPDIAHRNTWPRRLVYCLPMRTLVEQTAGEVKKWIAAILADNSGELALGDEVKRKLEWLAANSPVILMGGEDAGEWDIHPEREAILIGTQDMLLSRALNRGYAAGRARWPKDLALLNNDCLWVFDEVQLMDTSFAASLQLQAWRERAAKPAIPTASWWMSATLEKEWLNAAVDFAPSVERLWEVSEDETEKLWTEDVEKRSESADRLRKLLRRGTKTFHTEPEAELKADKEGEYIAKVATALDRRMPREGGKTLIILNSVRRACALADKLKDKNPLLLHSRFRHRERKPWLEMVKSVNLIIATQVVEAGLDITSRVLFTEICPWPSFIQRCGRAARYADDPKADVYWLDVVKDPLPYEEEELAVVQAQFRTVRDVSLAGFRKHRRGISAEAATGLLPYAPRFVPRLKDFLGLFDTTPDLTGADIDISRYIRDGDEHDVSVFWRDCSRIGPGKNPSKSRYWRPEHAELCPVPVWGAKGFRTFVRTTVARIWRWDYQEGWILLNRGDDERIFPGQVFLLEKECGGYDPSRGWTAQAEDSEFHIGPWQQAPSGSSREEDSDENPSNAGDAVESSDGCSNSGKKGEWRTILAHSREVCEELAALLECHPLQSPVDDDARVVLPLAARLHDWGKAHISFKHKVEPDELAKANREVPDGFPAKAPHNCWRRDKLHRREQERDHRRAGFRHELASALGILELLRRHWPNHAALAWPDAELRTQFGPSSRETFETRNDDALAKELAALTAAQFNLLIYLVAAHHGKVRMSLCSSPDDLSEDVPWPCPPGLKQARGVREGDALPGVMLPAADFASAQVSTPAINLRLDVMELGLSPDFGPSWRERAEALLAQHGPFRLAWYEALLRISDSRASKRAAGEAQLDSVVDVSSNMELREESPRRADTPPLSEAERSLVADLVADGLSIQEKFRPEPLYKQTGQGHYDSDTVKEVKKAKEQSRGTQKS